MNFKKRVNGSWTDTPHYIHNTSTDTITTLPANIYPNATTAIVGLSGNMQQSGTPSPTSPIQPSETGERTAQLIPYPYYSADGEYAGVQFSTNGERVVANGTTTGGFLFYLWRTEKLAAGTYTITVRGTHTGASVYVRDITNARTIVSIYGGQTGDRTETFTLDSDISVLVYINASSVTTLDFNCTFMLNTGSEALPYQPYGYKLPISSANTTTPIYLGEVESTRQIKKLVLTGNESNWGRYPLKDTRYCAYLPVSDFKGSTSTVIADIICSHYTPTTQNNLYNGTETTGISGRTTLGILITDINISDENEFKAYLAQQYANGTPVTIWYVLATPQTAVVNEPLRKIGEYADSISNVSIPVTAGGDTISVGTTLQPSEVTVNYKGWHPVADVHERESGAWT